MMIMITRLPAEYPAGGDASVCAQSHLARGGARLVREEDDDGDNYNGDDDDLYIIGRFCLSVTFLLIPALPPLPGSVVTPRKSRFCLFLP